MRRAKELEVSVPDPERMINILALPGIQDYSETKFMVQSRNQAAFAKKTDLIDTNQEIFLAMDPKISK